MRRILILFSLLFILAGCSMNPFDNSIKVGISVEQSGVFGDYGTSYLQGVELAIKKINSQGGIKGEKVKLVVLDNQSDPRQAGEDADDLVNNKKVVALLGSTVTLTNQALAAKAESSKVPFITGAQGGTGTTIEAGDKTRSFVYSTGFNENVQGQALASYARSKLKKRKVYIYNNEGDTYSLGLVESFKKAFTRAGGKVTVGSYKAEDDLSQLPAKVKETSSDLIFLPGDFKEAARAIKLLRDNQITMPILGSESWDMAAMENTLDKNNLKNLYFSTLAYMHKNNHRAQVFIRDYKEENNSTPDIPAAIGYDNMLFLADAIKKAPESSPEAINKMIEKSSVFTGVAGDIKLLPDHGSQRRVSILTYTKGQKILMGVVYPQAQ